MPLPTPRPLLTKPPIIILTQFPSTLLFHMKVKTLIPILTIPILIVELTFTHLPQIILVEIIACIALFAQSFEPVLADVVVIVVVAPRVFLGGRGMAVGTAAAEGAVAGEEGRAGRDSGYEGVAGGGEEGGEGEGWGRAW